MPAPGPFWYRNYGNLATIGRRHAVADFGRLQLSRGLAWLLWGIVHIYFMIGFRRRLLVAVEWLWSYLTYQRGARLITGDDRRRVMPARLMTCAARPQRLASSAASI